MSRRLCRASVVSSIVACAAVAGPVAAAQGSDATLRATVKHAIPLIAKSQSKIMNGLATLDASHKVAPLVKAIDSQDTTLMALEKRLAGEKPSSTRGAKGKADILTGLRLIVGSNRAVVSNLKKASKHQSVSTAQLKAADNAAKRGNTELNAGGKLLRA